MNPTLMSYIDDALQKMSDNELRKMWKAIYRKSSPRLSKELYIQQISSRLADLDFPIGSEYVTHWLSGVYRLYYESTKNTEPAITQSNNLMEIADSLVRSMRRGK